MNPLSQILAEFDEKFPSHISMNHGLKDLLTSTFEKGVAWGAKQVEKDIANLIQVSNEHASNDWYDGLRAARSCATARQITNNAG